MANRTDPTNVRVGDNGNGQPNGSSWPASNAAGSNGNGFPKSGGITVANVAGLPTGAASGDTVWRDADGALWDTTNGVFVRAEQCVFPGILGSQSTGY